MKSTDAPTEPKRAYRQTTRAATAEANAQRVVEAFRLRLEQLWFDEIRLEDVAADSGVTVQTVIRRFVGKDGLLDAAVDAMATQIKEVRATSPGDIPRTIEALLADYEVTGDLVIRVLAQEERQPALGRMTAKGRAEHRDWIAANFAPWLDPLPEDDVRRRLDALIVATDVYIWKLIRRDMGRPLDELRALMRRLIDAALA